MYTALMLGKFYVVATPIGNLQDIGYRSVEVLKTVDLILAEDTRKTKILLSHYGIDKKLVSYHQHSQYKHDSIVLMLRNGQNISLVTDAGTPGIADPGNELVEYLLNALPQLQIIPIPGASSLTALLSVCGFNVNKFVFLGFIPKKGRTKLFEWLKASEISFAFLDSPHRIAKTLEEVGENLGFEKRVAVGRELTKLYETIYRGTVQEVLAKLTEKKVKGEVTVVLEL